VPARCMNVHAIREEKQVLKYFLNASRKFNDTKSELQGER